MTSDPELERLKASWTAEEPPELGLGLQAWLQRARRRNRRADVIAMIGRACGFAVYATVAVVSRRAEWVALGVAGCAFVAGAVGFELWSRRGTWRPASRSTRAFVELVVRRERASLRFIRFFWWLAAGWLLAIGIPFVYEAWTRLAEPPAASSDFFAGVAVGFVPLALLSGALLWRRQRSAARTLREAEQLLEQLTDPGG